MGGSISKPKEVKNNVETAKKATIEYAETTKQAIIENAETIKKDTICPCTKVVNQSDKENEIDDGKQIELKQQTQRISRDDIVRASWEEVKKIGLQDVGILFFKNVFTEAPEALQLFSFKDHNPYWESPTFRSHALNVVKHVGYAVRGLANIQLLISVLKSLGAKHIGKESRPSIMI